MTSLERVLTTLRFDEPDRVPYFEQGVASNVASAILGREAHTGGGTFRADGVDAAIAGEEIYQLYVDTFFADWCELVEALDFDVVTLPWAGGGANARKLDDYTYLYGDLERFWHVMRHDPVSDTFYTHDSSLRHPGALDQIESEVADWAARQADLPKPTPADFPLLRRAIERFGGQRAFGGGSCVAIPMEPAWWEAMLVIPETVERYVNLQADAACDEIDVLAEMGIQMIWGGGDLASNLGPAYSPEAFRRFMLEPLQRMTARAHECGLHYIFRTDGLTWPIAHELFVESGVDGYGEIDRQAGMTLADLRARLPHLILWGNVDCGRTLTSGAPEEVAAETRACIDAAAPGGGYILGSSNVIHNGVPAENLRVMIETCRGYGVY